MWNPITIADVNVQSKMYAKSYLKMTKSAAPSWANVLSKYGDDMAYIPIEHISPELCMHVVKDNGLALKYVPEKYQTPELRLAAVKQNGNAIEYVKAPDLTVRLCVAAVSQDGYSLRYIPGEFKTQQVCDEAVARKPFALQWAVQTPELCLMAVRRDSKAIVHVKDEFKTPEVCEAVVVSPFAGAGKYLPAEYRGRFDKFYEDMGYTTFGPIKVALSKCLATRPCKHYIIDEDGATTIDNSESIGAVLRAHGLSHPHLTK